MFYLKLETAFDQQFVCAAHIQAAYHLKAERIERVHTYSVGCHTTLIFIFAFSELVFPEFRMAERPQDLYMWPDSIEQVCIPCAIYLQITRNKLVEKYCNAQRKLFFRVVAVF